MTLSTSSLQPRSPWALLLLGLLTGSAAVHAADGGSDAGPALDAGTGVDAGATVDGGAVQDGGLSEPVDAGTPVVDAGVVEDAGVVIPPPDPVWTCDPTYYDAADGCDCECGIPDPDCQLGNQQLYGCPASVNSCSDDGYCEIPSCGNGTVQEDLELCDDGNDVAYDGCSPGCRPEAGWSCSADPTSCVPVPTDWEGSEGPYCSDSRYADGEFCDCGCGVLDPDCADASADCDGLPLGCVPTEAVTEEGEVDFSLMTSVPDLADNTRCIANVCGDTWVVDGEECDDGNATAGDLCDSQCVIETPEGWTCDGEYVLDDQCDCGCGALDPACPGAALDPAVDCAFDECRGPQFVDPTNHGLCLEEDPPSDDGGVPPTDDDGGTSEPPLTDGGTDEAPACESRAVPTGTPYGALAVLPLLLGALWRRRRW